MLTLRLAGRGVGVPLVLQLAGGLILPCIAAYPVLRQHTGGLALCLIALATANAPLEAVESATVLSMFSLSHQPAMAGAGDGTALQIVATALGSTRTWVHYTQLVTVVSWIVVLYAALWRAGWLIAKGFAVRRPAA